MIDRKTLIKNLTIGFIPLLIFIIVDEFFGLMAGLVVAITVGILETLFIYWRERRVDRFILFDTGLIIGLGLISLVLQNDIFFKLKPALIELILLVLLGISGFSAHPLLIKMTGRYFKDLKFSDDQIARMRRLMQRMFYLVTLHCALIVYTAFFMSTEVWGFVSGGLFYVIMGGFFLFEYGRAYLTRRRMMAQLQREEWVDVVSPKGEILGRAPRSEVHGNPALLHPVVHVHILNQKGELFLQKRSSQKEQYPEYWDTAVGGHVASGESIEHALHREAEEELGIVMGEYQPLFRYVMRHEFESELIHGYLLCGEGPFHINPREITEGRFWKVEEIETRLGSGVFTPNFEKEFALLKKYVFREVRKSVKQKKRGSLK